MREPIIIIDIHGIKCDRPGCGWKDLSAAFDPDAWLNMPCPECGANLLTPADYRSVKRLVAVIEFLNRWLWWLPRRKRPRDMKCGMDGSGKITLKPLDGGNEQP